MARSKLRGALDRYQGRNLKLELQRKREKEAEKKRRAKANKEDPDEEAEEYAGVDLDAAVANDDSGEWESEEDEEEDENGDAQDFDISRLNDSDSGSSESEDDDEGVDIAHRSSTLNGNDSKATKSRPNGKPQLDTTALSPTDMDDDIPLSDLSAASDTEDIVPHQRLTINNTAALERALSSFALPTASLPFSEHQSITTDLPTEIPDVEDELNRELAFYSQSLSSVKAARALLRKEGVPFTRPTDYFAEMVKSDEHMGKVKSKLIDEAASKKAAQEARRQRDLKKFGKQVQQEKLKERAKEKKDMLDKVKILKRKRQSSGVEATGEDDIFDVALEDAATSERKDREARRAKAGARGAPGQPNAKRQKKNEKFGFGGKKKFKKSSDAISSGDMSGFSTKKMKGQAAGKGGTKRLGKSRRAKMS